MRYCLTVLFCLCLGLASIGPAPSWAQFDWHPQIEAETKFEGAYRVDIDGRRFDLELYNTAPGLVGTIAFGGLSYPLRGAVEGLALALSFDDGTQRYAPVLRLADDGRYFISFPWEVRAYPIARTPMPPLQGRYDAGFARFDILGPVDGGFRVIAAYDAFQRLDADGAPDPRAALVTLARRDGTSLEIAGLGWLHRRNAGKATVLEVKGPPDGPPVLVSPVARRALDDPRAMLAALSAWEDAAQTDSFDGYLAFAANPDSRAIPTFRQTALARIVTSAAADTALLEQALAARVLDRPQEAAAHRALADQAATLPDLFALGDRMGPLFFDDVADRAATLVIAAPQGRERAFLDRYPQSPVSARVALSISDGSFDDLVRIAVDYAGTESGDAATQTLRDRLTADPDPSDLVRFVQLLPDDPAAPGFRDRFLSTLNISGLVDYARQARWPLLQYAAQDARADRVITSGTTRDRGLFLSDHPRHPRVIEVAQLFVADIGAPTMDILQTAELFDADEVYQTAAETAARQLRANPDPAAIERYLRLYPQSPEADALSALYVATADFGSLLEIARSGADPALRTAAVDRAATLALAPAATPNLQRMFLSLAASHGDAPEIAERIAADPDTTVAELIAMADTYRGSLAARSFEQIAAERATRGSDADRQLFLSELPDSIFVFEVAQATLGTSDIGALLSIVRDNKNPSLVQTATNQVGTLLLNNGTVQDWQQFLALAPDAPTAAQITLRLYTERDPGFRTWMEFPETYPDPAHHAAAAHGALQSYLKEPSQLHALRFVRAYPGTEAATQVAEALADGKEPRALLNLAETHRTNEIGQVALARAVAALQAGPLSAGHVTRLQRHWPDHPALPGLMLKAATSSGGLAWLVTLARDYPTSPEATQALTLITQHGAVRTNADAIALVMDALADTAATKDQAIAAQLAQAERWNSFQGWNAFATRHKAVAEQRGVPERMAALMGSSGAQLRAYQTLFGNRGLAPDRLWALMKVTGEPAPVIDFLIANPQGPNAAEAKAWLRKYYRTRGRQNGATFRRYQSAFPAEAALARLLDPKLKSELQTVTLTRNFARKLPPDARGPLEQHMYSQILKVANFGGDPWKSWAEYIALFRETKSPRLRLAAYRSIDPRLVQDYSQNRLTQAQERALVQRAQRALIERRCLSGTADGIAGRQTNAAVNRYQLLSHVRGRVKTAELPNPRLVAYLENDFVEGCR